jgi:hypothetical protein
LVEAIERLRELKQLPVGWDTYSANAVNDAVFRPVVSLLIHSVQRCQSPRITASKDGGVILLWEHGSRELEIEVAPSGSYDVYFADEATGEELDPGHPVTQVQALELLQKYCRAD